jgi:hypothetical protein
MTCFTGSFSVARHLHFYISRILTQLMVQILCQAILEVNEVIQATRKRIIVTLLLSIAILGQAFGAVNAAAQWRRYQRRDRQRTNTVLVGNAIGLDGRYRGLNHARVLTIPTRRRLPRTPIMRRVPIIPVTSLRHRRHYGN